MKMAVLSYHSYEGHLGSWSSDPSEIHFFPIRYQPFREKNLYNLYSSTLLANIASLQLG